MEIDRRWIRRQAQIDLLNGNRIVEYNRRRQEYNAQHPNKKPLPMLSYTEYMLRASGFDKTLRRLREATSNSNVVTITGEHYA